MNSWRTNLKQKNRRCQTGRVVNLISSTHKTPAKEEDTRKRASRFNRRQSPPRTRVQERDIQILEALYSYRMLTTSQITPLFFGTKKRAERRLRQLFDAELVERIFRPVVVGSAEVIYVLDNEGVNLLSQELGIDRDEINNTRLRAKKLKPLFLDHFIEVNEFRISVTRAASAHNCTLLFWKYDSELQNKTSTGVLISDIVVDPENPTQKIPVTPDGFFGLETPKGSVYFFVEVDRATMGNARFKRKMRGYARYWLDGVYQEKWGFEKPFRVLTSTTKRRVPNLLQTTRELSEKQLLPIFHFTERENITPERVFGQVWQIPDIDELHGLI